MIQQRIFLFLLNPISGTGNKKLLEKIIRNRCIAEIFEFSILYTNAEKNYAFLKSYCNEKNISDIIICGGDGTISSVIPFILHENINIGIIPMGSGNGLAYATGIPVNIEAALNVVFAGNASWVDGFYINDTFSCMLCGVGFDAVVALDFANASGRGLTTYITQSLKNWAGAKTYSFSIELQNILIETEAFLVNFATGNQYGNNITIAPSASLSDGLIDVVIIQKMSKARLLLKFVQQVLSGKPQEIIAKHALSGEILYYQAPELILHNPDLAPLHIDGDPAVTSGKFYIKCVPKAYRLLQP